MKTRFTKSMCLSLAVVLLIPVLAFSAPTIRMDMDPLTAGVQTEISVSAGDTFTTNIELFLPDSSASLSSFGFSLLWDSTELNTPTAGDITTFALSGGWTDLSYDSIGSTQINNISQWNLLGSTSGPFTGLVATVTWKASNPVTDGSLDITPGFYSALDAMYDKNGGSVTQVDFQGGKVNLSAAPPVVPEPISTTLFMVGGAVLGVRRFLRKK